MLCDKLEGKNNTQYSSFKVTIYEKNFKTAMDPSIWPEGACINKFFSHTHEAYTKRIMIDPFLLLIHVCRLVHKTNEIEIDFLSVDNCYQCLGFRENWL